jgi:uncharacterized membrane protein (Fun14 family)
MKQKLNKEFYINTGFAVFIFVLTLAFFKEYVFQSSSALSSVFSGLIGAVIGFGLGWFLKNKGIVIKIIILLIYVGVITVFAYNKKRAAIDNNSVIINDVNFIQGNWVTKENDLTLKLDISDEGMKMNFYPNNKQLLFDYEIQGKIIDFFNDKGTDNFQWEILKLTNDSLVVLEKEQILRFTKEQ